MNVDLSAPVFLLKESDEVILGDEVGSLVDQLVGDGDRTLLLAELSISDHALDEGGYTIGPVIDASQTFPFLSDRRIVIVRNAAVFSTKDQCVPLVHYLADPLETTSLVLVWEKDPRPNRQAKTPAVPKTLAEAIAEAAASISEALALARSRKALSLELRAATSLARLLQRRGQRAEALAVLDPVLGRFTEGQHLPDLREAASLIAELQQA